VSNPWAILQLHLIFVARVGSARSHRNENQDKANGMRVAEPVDELSSNAAHVVLSGRNYPWTDALSSSLLEYPRIVSLHFFGQDVVVQQFVLPFVCLDQGERDTCNSPSSALYRLDLIGKTPGDCFRLIRNVSTP